MTTSKRFASNDRMLRALPYCSRQPLPASFDLAMGEHLRTMALVLDRTRKSFRRTLVGVEILVPHGLSGVMFSLAVRWC